MVARGEVWLVALDPTVGREIKKTRPALILSPDELNEALETVIVAPMTTTGSSAPYHISLTFESRRGFIVAEQVRAVDKTRLVKRVGRVPGRTLVDALRVLQEMFAE